MSAINDGWVTRLRAAVDELLTAREKLTAIISEYVARDLGNTLVQANDFIGSNSELLKAEAVAAITSANTVETTLSAQALNLYKVRRIKTL